MELETLPLAAVLERNHVKQIDLLHIDTEGYDWIVLRQLDFNRFKPKVILFEHNHLNEADKKEAVGFLRNHYRIYDLDRDYLCRRI